MLRLDGDEIDVEIIQSVFRYGGDNAIQTVVHDITKHKHYEEKLRKQAFHDTLTGLPNRVLLMNRLEEAIAQAEKGGYQIFVLFVDIDRFKLVNDSLGHDVGDELLKTTAKRMLECVRQSDTLARLGGDEFVLLLGNAIEEETLTKLIRRILTIVSQPITLKNQEVSVTCSIGCSIYPDDGKDAITLLKHADTAMYKAKAEGRNNIQRYQSEMYIRVNERLIMETQLRHGLERKEFLVYYQPQVDLRTGKIIGAEALIRWKHPVLGLVLPAQFIPVAEETGLIVSIGEWVIRTACQQAKIWQDAGFPLHVTVNLSVQQLVLPELVTTVENALKDFSLSPKYLGLELTEHVSMKDPEKTVSILQNFRRIGVDIAIDDFGTGYSNLAYLKQFPIQRLKLDQSFISDLTHDVANMAIVQGIINICRGLRLQVIAEGVEKAGQVALLANYGCDGIQGNYFSEPLSDQQFMKLLSEGKRLIVPTKKTAKKKMGRNLLQYLRL
jgi:diguanylate cyclase (GGDEF)-like protein